jgi:hypothetical protein
LAFVDCSRVNGRLDVAPAGAERIVVLAPEIGRNQAEGLRLAFGQTDRVEPSRVQTHELAAPLQVRQTGSANPEGTALIRECAASVVWNREFGSVSNLVATVFNGRRSGHRRD